MRPLWIVVAALASFVSWTSASSFATINTAEEKKGFLAKIKLEQILFGNQFQKLYEYEPFFEIAIGTPPQKVQLMFDTGSFTPTVYNKSCSLGCGAPGSKRYNNAASSTARLLSPSLITYGAGNVSGYLARDNFSFPEDTTGATGTFAVNFTLGDTTSWYPSQAGFGNLPNTDGIFGLGPGWPQIYSTGFNILTKQYDIEEVAVRSPRGEPRTEAVAQFGGYDKLNPELKEPVWVQANPEFPWFVVTFDDILVDGVSTGYCGKVPGADCAALLDTGGGSMSFQGDDVPQNFSDVTYPCNKIDGMLPSIGFVIGNHTLTLEPMDYVVKRPDGTCQSAVVSYPSAEMFPRNSQGELLKTPNGRPIRKHGRWLTRKEDILAWDPPFTMDFGIQWMSRFTTIFNWKNKQVGFIEHR